MEIVSIQKNGTMTKKENNHKIFLIENHKKDFLYHIQNGDSIESLKKQFGDRNFGYVYEGKSVYIPETFATYYVVRPLDTLTKICQKYQISMQEIVTLNHLKTTKLFVGQKLLLP